MSQVHIAWMKHTKNNKLREKLVVLLSKPSPLIDSLIWVRCNHACFACDPAPNVARERISVPWLFTLILSCLNRGGATKKNVVGTIRAIMYGESSSILLLATFEANLCTAVGNTVGPQFFLSSKLPAHLLGIEDSLIIFVPMAISGVVNDVLYLFENKRSDRLW